MIRSPAIGVAAAVLGMVGCAHSGPPRRTTDDQPPTLELPEGPLSLAEPATAFVQWQGPCDTKTVTWDDNELLDQKSGSREVTTCEPRPFAIKVACTPGPCAFVDGERSTRWAPAEKQSYDYSVAKLAFGAEGETDVRVTVVSDRGDVELRSHALVLRPDALSLRCVTRRAGAELPCANGVVAGDEVIVSVTGWARRKKLHQISPKVTVSGDVQISVWAATGPTGSSIGAAVAPSTAVVTEAGASWRLTSREQAGLNAGSYTVHATYDGLVAEMPLVVR